MELSEWLIVGFSGAVAASTVVYAVLTWKLVSETRRMREVQTEPRVSVRVEASQGGHQGYELVIRNDGQGPAKNVRFKFKGDPSYFRNSWIGRSPPSVDQLPAIKDGLDNLEPGQTFRFPLGSTSEEEFSRATQAPWVFHVKYQSLFGKCKLDTFPVDFSQFQGTFFERTPLKEISEHLDSIQKDLHRFTEGYARVQVVTQTREAFLTAREEHGMSFESEATSKAETLSDENI